ncbi:MAG: GGDEF domain-containing protein [Smithella sp.]
MVPPDFIRVNNFGKDYRKNARAKINMKSVKGKKKKCWEYFTCNNKECPACNSKDIRCWLHSGTHCRNKIQGKFLEKMEICLKCKVFKSNFEPSSIKDTFKIISKQFKEYKKIVDDNARILEKFATTDNLTGALNRTKFNVIIEREIEMVKRYDQLLSMIIFDIDHFKKINDRYGHAVGDSVLRTIADIVRENTRKTDYFIRWGGEEFMILSSETNLDKERKLAEKIRQVIENKEFENAGRITVSLGVTECKNIDTVNNFIKRADDALYKAKKIGRNRVEVII